MNLKKNEIYIFPFYSDYNGIVKFEHFNVKDDEALIRGLHLKKERLSTEDVVLYSNGKKLEGNIFYWKTVSEDIDDMFKKGLKLTEEGLGF
jgi:hypothetical protein